MSNGRKHYEISEMKAINKALGIKVGKPKTESVTYDEKRRKAQRAKFCTCRECGGAMTFVPNTNTLVCDNIVEKKKKKKTEHGNTETVVVTERCGWVNIVSEDYVPYVNYLFDGVPANQAVIEAAANKKEEK